MSCYKIGNIKVITYIISNVHITQVLYLIWGDGTHKKDARQPFPKQVPTVQMGVESPQCTQLKRKIVHEDS
ncbi:hypothetical protein NQ317_012396 [Molorchus minor]|uniref:Uncharacterized protein n=1 Tax=Molorchus minor TaxID=1323400 RepID=A0ABQ9JIL6_9CUCU|nr:hypothetical protein NQ317_012396 [Molorchus minor]